MMTISGLEKYGVGPIASIPAGEGRNFRVADREVAVFRTRAGEVFATQAHCPHRGAPLADGIIGGGRIICPFHSYAFDLTTGDPLMNSCPALKTYPVSVDGDGEIFIAMDEDDQTQSCLR